MFCDVGIESRDPPWGALWATYNSKESRSWVKEGVRERA